jgi:tripartite-type tricarboxylate transporter receptor subunit TctC
MLTRRWFVASSIIASSAAPLGARAREYPTGSVKMIVSFPAGGSTDVIVRAVSAKLQPEFGKPVLVENRAGASGLLASEYVAKAEPDGLTLLAAASSLASNPTLYKEMPFDTLKDLRPISLLFRTPLVLIVNLALPVKSVTDLIALLKQKPGQLYYGHGGPGSAIHLAAELFQVMTGTKINGVAYRGAPLALNDLIGGRLQLMFADVGSATGQIEAGQVRALGISSTERVPALPNLPTIAEAGVTGFDAEGWSMICAPAATPPQVVAELAHDIELAVETPDVQALIIKFGLLPTKGPPPPELKTFLATEIDRWGKLIKLTGGAKSL